MNLAADVGDFNLNPDAQKILLKFAVNQPQTQQNNDDENAGSQEVPIANFKSNKLSQIDKKQRQTEVEELKKSGKDAINVSAAVRMPNGYAAKKGLQVDT